MSRWSTTQSGSGRAVPGQRAAWAFHLSSFIFLLSLLSACAAPPPAATPAALVPSATATAAPAASPTPRPTAPPPSPTPAPEPLTIWVAEEGPALEAVERFLGEAAGTTPVRVLPRPADTLRLSLATDRLLGEPPPDLIWADGQTLAGLLADGQIQPIGPASAAGEALPALRTGAVSEGKLWGMPITAQTTLLLLYNRELIAEPPRTSDALIAQARAATSPEQAGLVQNWVEASWLLPWLYALGGAPTDAAGERPTLDTPAMEDALDLLRALYDAAPDNGDAYRRGQRLFAQGYAALTIDGDWSLEQYRAVSDTLTLGIAPLPAVSATGRPAAPLLGGSYLMLQRDLAGERLDQARAIVAALSIPPAQLQLARELGRLPALRPALGDLETDDPALLAARAQVTRSPGLPPTLAARCAVYGINVWLRSRLSDQTDSAETATNMQREAEACVTREGG